MRKELKVRESRKGEFDEFVAKLNKRAAKLNIGGVVLTWGEPELVPDKRKNPKGKRGIFYKVLPVVVEGEEPVIAGWMFRAAIDHLPTEENGVVNVLRVAPDYEIPEKYREAAPDCDHCGHNRLRRKTYVLEHEDGRTVQVGSTCIKDFLGGDLDPELAAKFEAELFLLASNGWDEEGGFGGGGQELFEVIKVLEASAAHVRLDGWMSRARARDAYPPVLATADSVLGWFCFNWTKADERDRKDHGDRIPNDRDRELAKDALEWAKGLTKKEKLSDYEYNLTALAQVEVIGYRHLGLLVSLVPVYEKHLGREVARKLRAEKSEHFGEVKKREIWELTPVRWNEIEGEWGTTYIVGFLSKDGNEAVWFASRNPDLEMGHTYKIKGTVKKHDEYQGAKQTHLTRCVVLEEIKEEAGDVG